jgi:hypothetical protein
MYRLIEHNDPVESLKLKKLYQTWEEVTGFSMLSVARENSFTSELLAAG